MTKKLRNPLSFLLIFSMLCSMCCITAFAQDDTSMEPADAADVVADFCDSAQDAANTILDAEAPPEEPDEPSTPPEPPAEEIPSAAPEQKPTAQPEETPAAPTEENTPAALEQNTSPEADSTPEDESPAEPLPEVPALPDGEPETTIPLPGVDTSEPAAIPETPEILVPDSIELPAETVSSPAPVPELVMPESMNRLPVPESVQAFLDAAAQIPAEITPKNAEEAGELINAALDVYEALQDTDEMYLEREDVQQAYADVIIAYQATDSVLNLESTTYDMYDEYLWKLDTYWNGSKPMRLFAGVVEGGHIENLNMVVFPNKSIIHVNETDTLQNLPLVSWRCWSCKRIIYEIIPDIICIDNVNAGNIIADYNNEAFFENFTLGQYNATDPANMFYNGNPAVKLSYKGIMPGETSIVYDMFLPLDAIYLSGTCDFCNAKNSISSPSKTIKVASKYEIVVNADYVLNYDANGGTGAPASQRNTLADTSWHTTISNAEPTRDGYKFLGWADSETATEAQYQPGSSITLDWVSGPTVSKTLYAVWEEDTPTEPTAPIRDSLYGILHNFVEVKCVTPNSGHEAKRYCTVNGHDDVTIGNVYSEDNIWFCKLTVQGTEYVGYYGYEPIFGTGVKHTLAEGEAATKTITLKWDSANSKWVEASGQPKDAVLATFKVVCAPPTPAYTYVTKWVNYNQTLLDQQEGNHPSTDYKGSTPTRPNEGNTKYTFSGWNTLDEITNGTVKTITYIAQYSSETVTPPAKPKLTGFTKERLTSAPEGVELKLDGTTINYDTTVKLGTDETATLLYKITVTGEKDAEYTVSDTMNGKTAIRVGSAEMSGTLDNSGKAVIYVIMTFEQSDVNADGKIVNKATLTPGDNTDKTPPSGGNGGEDKTDGTKTYNVTINFKTDDENPEILKDPIKDTYDNGTEYSYTVESAEGIALLADNVPTNIPIRLEKDGKHYALDPVLSKNALDKLTDTIQDNDVEVDLIYSLDNVGYITKDSDTSDGIPDKYQAKVVFVAGEGGTQSGEGFYKTFTDESGKYQTSGTITIPEGIIAVPADKYKFIGWTQSDNVGEGINLDNAALSSIFQGKGGETYIFTANFAMSSIPLEPAIVRLTVNIVGNTKTVPYDGQPQSVDGFTATVTAPEGVTVPDDAVQVALAEGFTAAASGTEAGNYPMNLTKEHFVVTVSDNTKYIAEIGQLTDGWLKITEATTPVDPVDPTPALDVTAGNVTATYDGQPHPVSPSANKPDAQFTVTYTDAAGNTLPGVPVDAGTYTATITAVLGDETDTATATVTISPRPITITTSSASKVYDGTALTSNTYTIANQEMVAGETVTITITGSQTSVGSSSNTYSITWNGTAKQTNYTITNSLGTLTVTERTTSGGGSGGGGGGGNRRPTGGSGGSTTIPENPTPLNPTAPDTKIDDEKVPLADLSDLNTADHFAYLVGYTDGTVRPTNNISRAEVATIFFRLMQDNYRLAHWASDTTFSDVQANAWYTAAIGTDAKAGLVSGYPDGTFRPDNNITRAEFAVIAAQFLSKDYEGEPLFTDISGHWAEKYINRAAHTGWIHGSGDKTFRPDDYITRAEVATLVNAMLGRTPDKDHMLDTMKQWPDNPESAWYYAAIQEATNSHLYTREEGAASESWTELQTNPDWAALQQQWAQQAAGN